MLVVFDDEEDIELDKLVIEELEPEKDTYHKIE
jgi:hypothetical protein